MIVAEYISDKLRALYKQQSPFDNGCDRERLGEHDERAAQSQLRPRTGAVSSSVRDFIGGAMGGYRR